MSSLGPIRDCAPFTTSCGCWAGRLGSGEAKREDAAEADGWFRAEQKEETLSMKESISSRSSAPQRGLSPSPLEPVPCCWM
jgi:hypothetical protein